MSIVSERTAIISLGVSCQTSHQLRSNQAWISDLTGETFVEQTCPFDWMICPLTSVVRTLETARFFPDSVDELVRHSGFWYWPEMGSYFWHEKHLPDNFAEVREKFQHLTANFEAAMRKERRIFVMSNTQLGLDVFHFWTGNIPITIDPPLVRSLAAVLRSRFGEVELHFVCDPNRVVWAERIANVHMIDMTSNRMGWEGDDSIWRLALRETMGFAQQASDQA